MTIITQQQLSRAIPRNKEVAVWLPIINEMLVKYDINTTDRVAGFIAQCSHESVDFTKQEENLNYSAKRLTEVWASRFRTLSIAQAYAGNPEKLANFVYGNRMGNGPAESGDGWRFRGGGIKQLTGRNNYTDFGRAMGMTAEEAAAYVRTKKGSAEAAAWFWKTNNLNAFADADDIVGMSRRINGGNVGLQDRTARYAACKVIFAGLGANKVSTPTQKPASPTAAPTTALQRGDKGERVKRLQRFLGFDGAAADGDFGPATHRQVLIWQTKNNVKPTGIFTKEDFEKLIGVW